jgi:hypothetical protein
MVRRSSVAGSIVPTPKSVATCPAHVVREMKGRRKPARTSGLLRVSAAGSRSAWTFRPGEEIKAIVGALEGRWRPIILTAIFTGPASLGAAWAALGERGLAKGEIHVRERADRVQCPRQPEI